MDVEVKLLKELKLKDPIFIGGLPGIGYVAKLSADYLIEALKAEVFCEIYSSFFPPHVLINKQGIVELMKNEIYFWKNIQLKNDLVIFTGNTQAASAEGQYAVAQEVLNIAQKIGVKRLYSLAAYVSEEHIEKPKVYLAATEQKLIKEAEIYDVSPMEEGSVSGTNGLLFGLAKSRNIEGICLLGETPGYTTPAGRSIVDAKSAQALLEVLTKILGIEINMAPLENQAKMTTEFIQKLEDVERRMLEQFSVAPTPKDRMYYI